MESGRRGRGWGREQENEIWEMVNWEEEWEEDETTKKPAPIVEVVTGIRRNWQGESTCVVLSLRCEGMSKMEFFSCGSTQCTGFMDPYPSYGDLWLADDEERALAEALLLEGP